MDPLITVITVSLNSEKTILNCLESLNSQTYSNYEHLIIDGESKDKTIEIIQSFSSNKIRLISEKDNGIYDALNKGIELSQGDVIGFVHSDDFLASPLIIAEIVKKISDKNLDGVYGDLYYVQKNNVNTNKLQMFVLVLVINQNTQDSMRESIAAKLSVNGNSK